MFLTISFIKAMYVVNRCVIVSLSFPTMHQKPKKLKTCCFRISFWKLDTNLHLGIASSPLSLTARLTFSFKTLEFLCILFLVSHEYKILLVINMFSCQKWTLTYAFVLHWTYWASEWVNDRVHLNVGQMLKKFESNDMSMSTYIGNIHSVIIFIIHCSWHLFLKYK